MEIAEIAISEREIAIVELRVTRGGEDAAADAAADAQDAEEVEMKEAKEEEAAEAAWCAGLLCKMLIVPRGQSEESHAEEVDVAAAKEVDAEVGEQVEEVGEQVDAEAEMDEEEEEELQRSAWPAEASVGQPTPVLSLQNTPPPQQQQMPLSQHQQHHRNEGQSQNQPPPQQSPQQSPLQQHQRQPQYQHHPQSQLAQHLSLQPQHENPLGSPLKSPLQSSLEPPSHAQQIDAREVRDEDHLAHSPWEPHATVTELYSEGSVPVGTEGATAACRRPLGWRPLGDGVGVTYDSSVLQLDEASSMRCVEIAASSRRDHAEITPSVKGVHLREEGRTVNVMGIIGEEGISRFSTVEATGQGAMARLSMELEGAEREGVMELKAAVGREAMELNESEREGVQRETVTRTASPIAASAAGRVQASQHTPQTPVQRFSRTGAAEREGGSTAGKEVCAANVPAAEKHSRHAARDGENNQAKAGGRRRVPYTPAGLHVPRWAGQVPPACFSRGYSRAADQSSPQPEPPLPTPSNPTRLSPTCPNPLYANPPRYPASVPLVTSSILQPPCATLPH